MSTNVAALAPNAERARSYSDGVALIGRLLLAAIFVLSGFGKVADPGGTIGYIAAAGLPVPQLAFASAALVELGGGIALILGYRTRLAAAALALFSILAALSFHANFADQNQMIHFLKNFAMAGGLLQLFAFGGGRLSLDARSRA
jgi:putative oxidoreductase